MIRTFHKKVFAAALLMLAFVLCSCGRNDISLTINKNGSIDAQIVYGIDKTMVDGDDVLNQVKDLIKQPLDENKISYTEKDDGNFAKIVVEKHFNNAAALADAANWQGIPFVPKFTAVPAENAVTVNAKDGKITFDGTLNSDSFGATELLSENKKAFGASITITAEKEEGNGKSSGKNAMKWEGTAEDSVKLELTAAYKGEEFTEKDAPQETIGSETPAEQTGNNEKTDSADKNVKADKKAKKSGKAEKNHTVALILVILIAAAAAVFFAKNKSKKPENDTGEAIGNNESDTETEENEK